MTIIFTMAMAHREEFPLPSDMGGTNDSLSRARVFQIGRLHHLLFHMNVFYFTKFSRLVQESSMLSIEVYSNSNFAKKCYCEVFFFGNNAPIYIQIRNLTTEFVDIRHCNLLCFPN